MQTSLAATELNSYLPIALIVVMAITFAVVNLVGTMVLGPRRTGARKGMSYESGMNPIGNARKRFNVRFYIIAMVFLVFDIEIIFLYPWAVQFDALKTFGLIEMVVFIGTVFIAYAYVWRRGGLEWD